MHSSVMRQFGLVSDRRVGLAESGLAELLVACYHDFADDLTDKFFLVGSNWFVEGTVI